MAVSVKAPGESLSTHCFRIFGSGFLVLGSGPALTLDARPRPGDEAASLNAALEGDLVTMQADLFNLLRMSRRGHFTPSVPVFCDSVTKSVLRGNTCFSPDPTPGKGAGPSVACSGQRLCTLSMVTWPCGHSAGRTLSWDSEHRAVGGTRYLG